MDLTYKKKMPAQLSPQQTRLQSLGANLSTIATNTVVTPAVTYNGSSINDKRVRISLPPGAPDIYYKDTTNSLLSVLTQTNGVLFPLQPAVNMNFAANYEQTQVTHSNFAYYGYKNSEIKSIDVSCVFPVRTPYEGWYVLATINFLRALTMMFTGNDGNYAGSPPPVVRLTGMGFGGFDNIPVVITNVATAYPDNVDYLTVGVPIQVGGTSLEYAKVPTETTITISCQPMFSRTFASQFSATLFGSGANRLLGPTVKQTLDDTNSATQITDVSAITLDTQNSTNSDLIQPVFDADNTVLDTQNSTSNALIPTV